MRSHFFSARIGKEVCTNSRLRIKRFELTIKHPNLMKFVQEVRSQQQGCQATTVNYSVTNVTNTVMPTSQWNASIRPHVCFNTLCYLRQFGTRV